MPTACLLTVHASQWTSFNMFFGGRGPCTLGSKFKKFEQFGGGKNLDPVQGPPVDRQNDRQTHMTENITFPQRRCQAVMTYKFAQLERSKWKTNWKTLQKRVSWVS